MCVVRARDERSRAWPEGMMAQELLRRRSWRVRDGAAASTALLADLTPRSDAMRDADGQSSHGVERKP